MKKLEVHFKDDKEQDFKTGCDHYKKLFGLKDWDIVVDCKSLERGRQAQCAFNVAGRAATITINSHTTSNPRVSACHEMLHLILAKLEMLAQWRDTSQEVLDAEVERTVVHLTNIIIETEAANE